MKGGWRGVLIMEWSGRRGGWIGGGEGRRAATCGCLGSSCTSKVVTNKTYEVNRRSTSVKMRIDSSMTTQKVLIFNIISGSPGKGICIEGDINRVLYVLQRRYSIAGTQDA